MRFLEVKRLGPSGANARRDWPGAIQDVMRGFRGRNFSDWWQSNVKKLDLLLMEGKNSAPVDIGRYPIIYKVLYIPGGAGFLPSTVFILILKTYLTVVVAWIRFTKLLFLAVQKLTTIGQWSPKNDQLEYEGYISFMVIFQSVKLLIIWAAEKKVSLVGTKTTLVYGIIWNRPFWDLYLPCLQKS